MTEDEAKAKWCPFARQTVTLDRVDNDTPVAVGSGNRFDGDRMSLCIGSGCMAWRTGGDRAVPASITEIAGHMREHSVGPLDAAGATAKRVRTGYCGLAGAPA